MSDPIQKRDLVEPVSTYLKQAVELAMNQYDISYAKACEIVEKANKELDINPDPLVQFNQADEHRDSYPREDTLRSYLNNVINDNLIVTPSLSTYIKDEDIVVPEAGIVGEKMKSRGEHKKLLFKYTLEGNKTKAEYHNTYQIGEKTVSNSISGAISVGGSIMQNPASHSTLTSGARISTSTPNGQIERFITGDIHFKDLNSTLGYMGAILQHIRDDRVFRNNFSKIIKNWQLAIPSADTVMEWLEENTRWYFRYGYSMMSKIVSSMSGLERAYFYYNGSLWSIWSLNQSLIEVFLRRLIEPKEGEIKDDNAKRIKVFDELTVNTARHIYSEPLKGVSARYDDEEFDKQVLANLIATSINVDNILLEFKPLIDTILKVTVMIPNVGYYKECIRNAIVVNDTDSGVYHIGVWTEILFGTSSIISPETTALCGVFTQITSLSFTHAMIHTATNMNVDHPEKKTIDMKNEYTISTMGLPARSKHYFMKVTVIEGNVLPKAKIDKKGVGFKNASTPPIVKAVAEAIELDLPKSIEKHGCIDVYKYLDLIVQVERLIMRGAMENGIFYRSQDIKSTTSLIAPWKEFWNNSPLHSLGEVEIPSTLVKIPTKLTNKRLTMEWLDTLDDEYSVTWRDWVASNKPNGMPRIFLPADVCLSTGIPEIFKPIIEPRELVVDICGMLYVILECLGIYMPNGVMLSDIYTSATHEETEIDFVTKLRKTNNE